MQVAALCLSSPAFSQYSFIPSSDDEPGIRYFGSVKDEKGTLLTGVSVLIESGPFSYLFVTDELGRFKGNLPVRTLPETVTVKCSKTGFTFVKMMKRLAPRGAKPAVQADCVLHASAAP